MKKLPHQTPGIYRIRNQINNKCYVGQAKKISKRWYEHKRQLSLKEHSNVYLQNSWNLYGCDSFVFEVLEFTTSDKETLISREQHWLDILKPEFNVCKIAGTTHGRPTSQETKDKIGKANTGRKMPPRTEAYRRMLSERISGLKRSDETRKRISEAKKNCTQETREKIRQANLGKKMSSEVRLKMSLVHPRLSPTEHTIKRIKEVNSKKVLCLNNGIVYASTTEASIKLNLHRASIGRVALGYIPHYKNFRFEYVKEK